MGAARCVAAMSGGVDKACWSDDYIVTACDRGATDQACYCDWEPASASEPAPTFPGSSLIFASHAERIAAWIRLLFACEQRGLQPDCVLCVICD